jgi:hypothetical protein
MATVPTSRESSLDSAVPPKKVILPRCSLVCPEAKLYGYKVLDDQGNGATRGSSKL